MKRERSMPHQKEGISLKYYAMCLLKGICMGSADVIPGVSGGTMALILGIYEKLVSSLRSFDTRFLKLIINFKIKDAIEYTNLLFLASVGAGILIAVFSLARAIGWMLQNVPVLIWSFFFGLVLASALTIGGDLPIKRPGILLSMLIGGLIGYFLLGITPMNTPDTRLYLFLSGAIAICAMVLPGISGAFILVILGKYQFILKAVSQLELLTILIFALGAGAGLMSFVRLLDFLLKKNRGITISFLCGLMVGSLRKIWPWKREIADASGGIRSQSMVNILPERIDSGIIFASLLMIAGFSIVIIIQRLSQKKEGGI